jgi:peptidyl-prolyl cis-trans isomerase A (cyclophilin A)
MQFIPKNIDFSGVAMRKISGAALEAVLFATIFATILAASSWAQTKSATKPPVHHPHVVAAEPTAIIHTTAGNLRCTLFPHAAPIGVANFIGLATGTKDWINPFTHKREHHVPLYNGTIFHRVIPEFMIQGGDPKGDGTGDPGYQFKNETSPNLTFDRPGRLAYANAGPNTNGSQFFITEVPYPSLDGNYTIFGQCDEASVAVVKQIARMARDPRNDRPYSPVKITHITILRGAATVDHHVPMKHSSTATSAHAGNQ